MIRRESRKQSASSIAAPRIDRFDVEPPSPLVAGADLIFALSGSPGGTASVKIVSVKGKLALDEVRAHSPAAPAAARTAAAPDRHRARRGQLRAAAQIKPRGNPAPAVGNCSPYVGQRTAHPPRLAHKDRYDRWPQNRLILFFSERNPTAAIVVTHEPQRRNQDTWPNGFVNFRRKLTKGISS